MRPNEPKPELPPSAYGCGEYPDWIEREAVEAWKERQQEKQERFGEHIDANNAHLYGGAVEREFVGYEIPLFGRTLDDWNQEVDCTLFARRFLRWVESGCPVMKGRT